MAAYERLGLISYFTVGQDEVRAWTTRKGSDARTAAGAIHHDIRGDLSAPRSPRTTNSSQREVGTRSRKRGESGSRAKITSSPMATS